MPAPTIVPVRFHLDLINGARLAVNSSASTWKRRSRSS